MAAKEQVSDDDRELELIGVGFGRTGTDSTRIALNQLGFPCYHMFEVLDGANNPEHLDFWVEVAESEPGAQHDWSRVLSRFRATVDNPAACVWRELIEAYPNAKVLLTQHPQGANAWYQSTWDTIYMPQRRWEFRLLSALMPPAKKMDRMVQLIWQRFHKGTMPNREAAIARYHEHHQEVTDTVPADRLLVFKASDGWEPLCAFLGVSVPEGPFPRTNDRAQMQRWMSRRTYLAYAVVALPLLVIAAALWVWLR